MFYPTFCPQDRRPWGVRFVPPPGTPAAGVAQSPQSTNPAQGGGLSASRHGGKHCRDLRRWVTSQPGQLFVQLWLLVLECNLVPDQAAVAGQPAGLSFCGWLANFRSNFANQLWQRAGRVVRRANSGHAHKSMPLASCMAPRACGGFLSLTRQLGVSTCQVAWLHGPAAGLVGTVSLALMS